MTSEEVHIKYDNRRLYVFGRSGLASVLIAVVDISHNFKKFKVIQIDCKDMTEFETIVLPKIEKYRDYLFSTKSIL